MTLRLMVNVEGEFGSWDAGKDIEELYRREFEPLKTCDDPSMAYISGDNLAGSIEARTVIKARKDAAEILARELAEFIVAAMERNDTHNGYRK
jgi:hypothetical protein